VGAAAKTLDEPSWGEPILVDYSLVGVALRAGFSNPEPVDSRTLVVLAKDIM